MTNELKEFGEGAYIQEFAAGGPKNYGYRVCDKNGKFLSEMVKVRGFRLNYQNKKTINFDCLRRLIFEYCIFDGKNMYEKIFEKRILRDRNHLVFTEMRSKLYRIVYTKRTITPNFYTLPYGY